MVSLLRTQQLSRSLRKLAGTVGLEPTTTRLTAERSAIELRTHNARILTTGGYEPPGPGIDQAFCKVMRLNQRRFALSVLDRDTSCCLRVCCANSYLGAGEGFEPSAFWL